MLGVFHLFQPFGYYGFGTLAALVLVSRGYDVTSSLLFTALSFIGYPLGSLISVPLLKRFERKYLVMTSVVAMAFCGMHVRRREQPYPDRRVRLADDCRQ